MDNKSVPRLFADFNNVDRKGRVRLNTRGTQEDLRRLGVNLTEGLQLVLYDGEEFVADAKAHFSDSEGWVGIVNWRLLEAYHDNPGN